jgi:type VI secretion system secreted protein Hcp
VLVCGYDIRTEDDSERLQENIALNFASVEVSYQAQKADGAKEGGPVKFGWNIRQNVKI